MLRTAPNYPQTLIFGILLFLLVPKIITFFYSKNIGRLLWVYLFLCAFISGFALYTYGQILVFLLAICFYLFLIYLLENLKIHNQNLMRALFYPIQKGSHKIVKVIGGLLCVIGSLHLALGSIFYVFSIQEISLFQFVIKFHGLHLLEAGVKLILVLHLISHSKFIFNSILHSMKVSITLLVGFSMGYLPALVYKWNPMNTASAPVTQIKGSFSDLMGGVSLSVHGFLYWLNLENASYFLFIVLVIFLLFCVFVFYFPYIKKIISAFKEKDTRFLFLLWLEERIILGTSLPLFVFMLFFLLKAHGF